MGVAWRASEAAKGAEEGTGVKRRRGPGGTRAAVGCGVGCVGVRLRAREAAKPLVFMAERAQNIMFWDSQ